MVFGGCCGSGFVEESVKVVLSKNLVGKKSSSVEESGKKQT